MKKQKESFDYYAIQESACKEYRGLTLSELRKAKFELEEKLYSTDQRSLESQFMQYIAVLTVFMTAISLMPVGDRWGVVKNVIPTVYMVLVGVIYFMILKITDKIDVKRSEKRLRIQCINEIIKKKEHLRLKCD